MLETIKGVALGVAFLGSTVTSDKVTLVCSGTTNFNPWDERPASMSVTIDLDVGTMTTDLGVLTIAKTTDTELQLEKLSSGRSEIDARFDRISCHLSVWDWRHGGLQQYDLTCKGA
jgi:hypothetical protein